MAKQRNTGLGRGLDSLIPKIDEIETDVDEGLSLEDMLKDKEESEKSKKSTEKEIKDEKEKRDEIKKDLEETVEETVEEAEDITEAVPENDLEEEVEAELKNLEEIIEDEIEDESSDKEEESSSKKDDGDSSEYTNVFNNDDEIKSSQVLEKTVPDKTENEINIIKETVNLNEKNLDDDKIIEDESNLNKADSLLSEKEEKLVCEVIETVENNPRITLWSARSAAVLRYLRKTEPEFSISNEASNLIDEAIAEKYPEIWTLFNHL